MAIEDRIDFLYERVGMLLFKYIEQAVSSWEEGSAGFNEGQYTILMNNVIWPLTDWIYITIAEWPWVIVDDYMLACYEAYDWDVMERAFSDTIERPVGRMGTILDQAQSAQAMMEALIERLISFG